MIRTPLIVAGVALAVALAACSSSDDNASGSVSDAGSLDALASEGGTSPDGASNVGAPVHGATSISFVDHQIAFGALQGNVMIGKASDESDVTTYDLYWGGNFGGATNVVPLQMISSIPKTGSDLTYALTAPSIPTDADHLVVYTANALGEMTTGTNTPLVDYHAVYTDISAGQGANCAASPSPLFDATNNKLLVVGTDDASPSSGVLSLYRCNPDATGCAYVNISAGHGTNAGYSPAAVVDTTNKKLIVITSDESSSPVPAFFRCDLTDTTGATCTYQNISAGQPTYSAQNPMPLVDSTNQKLLVVAENNSTGKPVLTRCALDGTACTYIDISGGAPAQSANGGISAAIDSVSAPPKLVVGTSGSYNLYKPSLFRCNLDGTGCTNTDISAGQPADSAFSGSLLVDTTNSKLLLITIDGAKSSELALFRANLDGTGATYVDISAGQGAGSGGGMNAVIDNVGQRFFATTGSGLVRCNVDGTGCVFLSISYRDSGPRSVIDTTDQKLLVVATNIGPQTPGVFGIKLGF